MVFSEVSNKTFVVQRLRKKEEMKSLKKEERKEKKRKRGALGINICTYIHVQDVSQNVEYNNQYEG